MFKIAKYLVIRPNTKKLQYPKEISFNTTPKYLSQRTSYILVRLAFHPLAQVIQNYCNNYWFGPPKRYSLLFSLLMLRSLIFESYSHKLYALFILGFPTPLKLAYMNNLQIHYTKGTNYLFYIRYSASNILFMSLFQYGLSKPTFFQLSLTLLSSLSISIIIFSLRRLWLSYIQTLLHVLLIYLTIFILPENILITLKSTGLSPCIAIEFHNVPDHFHCH